MSSSSTFMLFKVDGDDGNPGTCKEVFIYTVFIYWVDVNFNSKKVHEDDIFVRQDILQFFSVESNDYKCLKSP